MVQYKNVYMDYLIDIFDFNCFHEVIQKVDKKQWKFDCCIFLASLMYTSSILSYLQNRKQSVEVCGKKSKDVEISTRTPQGFRLSPLLFIILMSDLNLWTENSILSNFADDTQSIIISNNKENLLKVTLKEANSVIKFFANNHLVNNAEKAAVLYNHKGKGDKITVKNIGGENIESSFSEKLLGLHINSDFEWSTHVEKISTELRQ